MSQTRMDVSRRWQSMTLRPRMARLPLALVATLALLPGCAQSMFKATPFAGGEHSVALGDDESRINLWPIAYHREPATSILWPIGEVTDTSWAVRPLIAVYDQNQRMDIAWPFLHLDRERDSGYLFPVVGWRPKELTVFPLFHSDRADGRFLSLPWAHGERFRSIPVLFSAWGTDASDRPWGVTPFYSSFPNDGLSNDEGRVRTVPPLLSSWTRSPARNSTMVLGGLFSHESEGDVRRSQLFPLYRHYSTADEKNLAILSVPLIRKYRPFQSPELGLSLIASRRTNEHHSHQFLPFYRHVENEDSRSTRALLAFHYSQRQDRVRYAIDPLFSLVKDDESRELDLVWPLYRREWGGEKLHQRFLPLYWHSREPGRSTLAVAPLWFSQSRDGGRERRALPALLTAWAWDEDGYQFHTLLSGVAWGRSQESRFSRVFPFYLHRSSTVSGERHSDLRIPILLGRLHKSESSSSVSFPFFSRRTGVGRSDLRIAYLFRRSSNPVVDSSWFFPIYSWTHRKVRYEAVEDEESPRSDEFVSVDADERDFRLLFGLFDRRLRRQDDGSYYRRHRVLWRLYHDESLADKRSIDVFPFFTYDREGAEKTTWSWMYRVLRYERRGEAKKFTFLFVPFAWGEDDTGGEDAARENVHATASVGR